MEARNVFAGAAIYTFFAKVGTNAQGADLKLMCPNTTQSASPVLRIGATASSITETVTSYTFKAGDKILVGNVPMNLPSGKYGYGQVIIDAKGPVKGKFKIVENIYKSQLGDTSEIDFNNTVNIAGTMSDGTTFSIDALTK